MKSFEANEFSCQCKPSHIFRHSEDWIDTSKTCHPCAHIPTKFITWSPWQMVWVLPLTKIASTTMRQMFQGLPPRLIWLANLPSTAFPASLNLRQVNHQWTSILATTLNHLMIRETWKDQKLVSKTFFRLSFFLLTAHKTLWKRHAAM